MLTIQERIEAARIRIGGVMQYAMTEKQHQLWIESEQEIVHPRADDGKWTSQGSPHRSHAVASSLKDIWKMTRGQYLQEVEDDPGHDRMEATKVYWRELEDAARAGKSIPPMVRSQYESSRKQTLPMPGPVESEGHELIEHAPSVAKEHWQMTAEEFQKSLKPTGVPGRFAFTGPKNEVTNYLNIEEAKRDHRYEVKEAVAAGKQVRPEVLAEYPELIERDPEPASANRVDPVKVAEFMAAKEKKTELPPVPAEKPTHEMTRAEFHKSEAAKDKNYDVSAANKRYWAAIRDAASEGKSIPEDTRKQYQVMFGEELKSAEKPSPADQLKALGEETMREAITPKKQKSWYEEHGKAALIAERKAENDRLDAEMAPIKADAEASRREFLESRAGAAPDEPRDEYTPNAGEPRNGDYVVSPTGIRGVLSGATHGSRRSFITDANGDKHWVFTPELRQADEPREGERGPDGLVFHDHRWHREDEPGAQPESKPVASAAKLEANPDGDPNGYELEKTHRRLMDEALKASMDELSSAKFDPVRGEGWFKTVLQINEQHAPKPEKTAEPSKSYGPELKAKLARQYPTLAKAEAALKAARHKIFEINDMDAPYEVQDSIKRGPRQEADALTDHIAELKSKSTPARSGEGSGTGFKSWLNRFVDEKGIDREEMIEVEGRGGTHMMPVGVVLEHMLIAPKHEQDAIKDMIVKIDFKNGDVLDYFKHLAGAIAGEPEHADTELATAMRARVAGAKYDSVSAVDSRASFVNGRLKDAAGDPSREPQLRAEMKALDEKRKELQSSPDAVNRHQDSWEGNQFKARWYARELGVPFDPYDSAETIADNIKAHLAEREGPREGERNEDGLVFHDGRWHREDELTENSPELKSVEEWDKTFDEERRQAKSVEQRIAEAKARVTGEPIPTWDEVSEETAAADRSPHLVTADKLAEKLDAGDTISAKELFAIADDVHGGTRAQGKYGHSEATDSLEAAVNKTLDGKTDPTADLEEARRQAAEMAKQVDQLPTQTNRSGNKDDLQQFSTPPHYSFAVAWAANIKPGDVVLEPSAGTGSLAIHAKNAGADVYVNELDDRRADFLRDQFGADHTHVQNAEQIGAILPGEGVPMADVVIMNPPFSNTANAGKDLHTAEMHIKEAGLMLKPGGRLVSIVGKGMGPDSHTHRPWFRMMAENGYDLRANIGVNGDVYKKYGTSFDSRVLVFDKRDPTGEPAVTGDVDSIDELLTKLEGVRNDKQITGSQAGISDSEPSSNGDSVEDTEDSGARGELAGAIGGGLPVGDGGQSGAGSGSIRAAGGAGGGGPVVGIGSGTDGDGLAREPGAGDSGVAGASGAPVVGDDGKQPGKPKKGSGKAAGGQPRIKSKLPEISRNTRPPELLKLDPVDQTPDTIDPSAAMSGDEQPSVSLYEPWKPQVAMIRGAKPHPSPLVESAAMAGVRPPRMNYAPTLSPDLVDDGKVSAAQLENIAYAGQAHSQTLEPDKEGGVGARRGFFIGDGTGSAKGRQIAGIMADNFNQGRKRAVWLSKTKTLLEDARRDFADIGIDPASMIDWDHFKKQGGLQDGQTLFIPYTTLRSGPRDKSLDSNSQAIIKSLGPDFDGVIAFDEAHLMGNAVKTAGKRGGKEPSQQALAGVELQRELPNARVVYSSATGATEISNLSYADRLGLWGRGTSFNDKSDFINKMSAGGIATMEAIAQSMKATGSYASRSLAMSDGTPEGTVQHQRLSISLSDEQKAKYDKMADAWSVVLNNINEALKDTNGSADAKKNAMGAFWGAEQRFFNQVITSMATPETIKSIEKDLAEGRSPVIGVVNTGESSTKRAKARLEDDETIEDMDVSPREILMQYLENSFPIHRHETYLDDDGNERQRLVTVPIKDEYGKPVLGADGKPVTKPVEDPNAVRRRDALLDHIGSLKDVVPESPLDQIINHFGHEMVAEATGRTQRRILRKQPDGERKYELEKRKPELANDTEARAFQNGEKKILIFSDAGGTGRSYHASRKVKNQGRRVHYMLQPGWRADAAMQALGRTHRTNQSSAPIYVLPEMTEIRAQKRFISTIARRLDQLGALGKGQRQTGGGGMFGAADNLESEQAQDALDVFFRKLKHGGIDGLEYHAVMGQMGFSTEEDKKKGRGNKEEEHTMPQFLNRMLALKIDQQQKVFEAFDKIHQDTILAAEEAGELDHGVEDYKAHSVTPVSDDVVFRDPLSGASTRHVVASVKTRTKRVPFNDVSDTHHVGFFKNTRSGQVWAAYDAGGPQWNAERRTMEDSYILRGPSGTTQKQPKYKLGGYGNFNFDKLDDVDAEREWTKQFHEHPEFDETKQHFVTGALLPVWDKLPLDKPKVFRINVGGKKIVGRHIPEEYVNGMLDAMGAASGRVSHTAASAHAAVSGGKHTATLANGWTLSRRMVQGEPRIEIGGPSYSDYESQLESDGVIKDRIAFNTRYFIPTGSEGVKVLERVTKHRPVAKVEENDKYARIEAAAARIERYSGYGSLTDDQIAKTISGAARRTDKHPTPAQVEAGNYKKGKFWLFGQEVAIETPKGAMRRGVNHRGEEWAHKMPCHYGYLRRNKSLSDFDNLDCFIGPHPKSELVFVVDQQKPDGRWDEHKLLLGFNSLAEAKAAYESSYHAGWRGMRDITPLTKQQFLKWLEYGDTSQPIKRQVHQYSRVDKIAARIARNATAGDCNDHSCLQDV